MNKPTSITEREFEVINIIASGISSNQRAVADSTGISLGMTNLLLRRLVQKGYLRVQQLDRRKIRYLLTPQGFTEKARKSYHYTLKTISSMTELRDRIQVLVRSRLKEGQRVVLLGQSPLGDVVSWALSTMKNPAVAYTWVTEWMEGEKTDALILIADNRPSPVNGQGISLLDVLSDSSERTPVMATQKA